MDDDDSLKNENFFHICDFVLRDLADPDSFLAKPPGGTSETLKDENLIGDKANSNLDVFTKKWFSANRMSLVVMSKFNIENLVDKVVN